jgi:hypothetical protein
MPAMVTTGTPRPSPKAEKIDSVDCKFNFRKYGYRTSRLYLEGDFCTDVPRNPEANRLQLVNVKVADSVVTYQTSFNIGSSLLKSLFKLQEPKSVAASK